MRAMRTCKGDNMSKLMSGITATLCLINIAVAASETPAHGACSAPPTILSITPHASFAEIGESDAIPVYEVKYQHCEQIHRLLIQVPGNDGPQFQPIFF